MRVAASSVWQPSRLWRPVCRCCWRASCRSRCIPVSRYIESYWLIKGLDRAFDAFSRWDAWHYTRIALTGLHRGRPVAGRVLPALPDAASGSSRRLVGRTDRPGLFAAAVVVANMCLLLATMVLIALVRLDLDASDARRAAWYLLYSRPACSSAPAIRSRCSCSWRWVRSSPAVRTTG